MQTNYVIGLNSGTSFDGIDVALVLFKNKNLTPIFVDGVVYEYPKVIKEKIRQLITPEGENNYFHLREISQLNFF